MSVYRPDITNGPTTSVTEDMMAKQDSFLAEEWTRLRLTPSLVSAGMTAVEPSGIFASIKDGISSTRKFPNEVAVISLRAKT